MCSDEILTGQRPFSADSLEGYIQKHLQEKPLPPSKIKTGIPVGLEKIVLKCLEKKPADRYQTCKEIIGDLDSAWRDIRAAKYRKYLSPFRRPLFYLALCLPLFAAVYFLFFYGTEERALVSSATQMTLSVLPFQNSSKASSLDYYRNLFQEMMITDLEQSKFLRVIPIVRLNALLTKMKQNPNLPLSQSVLDKMARDEHIQYFVQGSYLKSGDALRCTVKIVKPFSFETLSSRVVQIAQGGNVLDHIDDLTVWLKTNLGFTRYEIISDYDKKMKSLTQSEQALQLYYSGQKCYLEGKYEKSIQFLSEAVELDPEFAMAYRGISIDNAYLQDLPKAREYGQKALDLAKKGHASLRDKLLIQGYAHYFLEGSPKKAIPDYEEVLRIYPNDEEAHICLGAIYRNSGQRDLAEIHFLKAQLYIPDMVHDNLVWIYLQKGQYSKAIDLLELNKDIISPKVFHANLANAYLCLGNVDQALQNAQKIEKIFPEDLQNIEFLGKVFQIKGDLEKARKYFLLLMKDHNYLGASLKGQIFLMVQEGEVRGLREKRKGVRGGI